MAHRKTKSLKISQKKQPIISDVPIEIKILHDRISDLEDKMRIFERGSKKWNVK